MITSLKTQQRGRLPRIGTHREAWPEREVHFLSHWSANLILCQSVLWCSTVHTHLRIKSMLECRGQMLPERSARPHMCATLSEQWSSTAENPNNSSSSYCNLRGPHLKSTKLDASQGYMPVNFPKSAPCTEVTPPVTIIYISKLGKLTLMAWVFFFFFFQQKYEYELTFSSQFGMEWGLELSSQRRFQSRYLSKSISMLQFNSQGQRIRGSGLCRVK